MNKEFLELLEKSKQIHILKNQDYTSGKNIDENFERIAILTQWFNNHLDKAYVGLVAVKLARLGTLLNKVGTTPNNESISDSFLDLFTYVGLWAANYERRIHINQSLYSHEQNAIFPSPEYGSMDHQRKVRESLLAGTEEYLGKHAPGQLQNKESKITLKEKKMHEIVNMYDELNEEDYRQLLAMARTLVRRK